MLKSAREAHGIHIEALASAIKVSIHKLELLESDRLDELPDTTFARALAKTVCRFLKIDPAPVLDKLPDLVAPSQLEHVAQGLNKPFRGQSARRDSLQPQTLMRPAVWLPLLLLAGALVLWFLPPGMLALPTWVSRLGAEPESSPATVQEPIMPPSEAAASETVHSAPLVIDPMPSASVAAVPASAAASAVGEPTGLLVLRASERSWIEVRDGNGRALISRVVAIGENITLEGPLPLRVRVGNVRGTQLVLRGQPVDLSPYDRDNTARLVLK